MKINDYFLFMCLLYGSISGIEPAMIPETNNTNPKAIERRNEGLSWIETTTLVRKLNLIDIKLSEDGLLNFTGLAKKYIRPAEEYDVTTEDGYILKMFHIPGNTSNVVLICHGLLSSSDDFLIRGNISLIYMLAKQDFDIWAINYRGNRYSRSHVTLNPDTDKDFWQFSMHEMGLYDTKAAIDLILNTTGQERLSVIGYSEGTSASFILLSERPEYNNKIMVFTALAPVCYLNHTGPTAALLFSLAETINKIFEILKMEEFIGFHSFDKRLMDIICSQGVLGYEFCFNVLGLITGFNKANIEQEFTSTILGHFPAGTSRKNLEHYTHIQRHNTFCHYDCGMNNSIMYNSFSPPIYNLTKVNTKVALFTGKGDLLLGIEDIKRLKKDLPNVVHYQVLSDKFCHLDYLWSRTAYTVLYPYVIDILIKYNMNA